MMEFAILIIITTPFAEEFAIHGKYLDSIIVAIRDVDAFNADICHTDGQQPWWESRQFQHRPHGSHDGCIHSIPHTDGHPGWLREFSVLITLFPPSTNELAMMIEALNGSHDTIDY